ncbi:MAG: extracellular solute-binding protein [Gemmatimonadaceae bacterium]|nr:extracellular solute-binding protein [Acetobacteraceae bacterium]
MLTRRQALLTAAATTVAGTAAAQSYTPPADLVAAARKEGRCVFYTASFSEPEQETIGAFNKRFPFVRVEMLRASGGQLITRVKTEAAAGKLLADVVDHSDRALMKEIEDLFADYAPPNAADYLPAAQVSPKMWPRITPVWCIAYHSELAKVPPKTWMDLIKTAYAPGQIGQVIAPSGGTTWTRVMFERQVLGEDYWTKQAATKPALYPSGAPLSDALIRGEVLVAPLIRNAIFSKVRDGAPVTLVFPPEGLPLVPYAAGIPKSSANPNAAKLFLDWCLSAEGQAFTMREQGNLTSLRTPPIALEGFDPNVNKVWVPDGAQFASLRNGWIEEWNKIYGYRQ